MIDFDELAKDLMFLAPMLKTAGLNMLTDPVHFKTNVVND